MENIKNEQLNEIAPRSVSDYEPPRIVTYTSDEIAERIGPAHACTGGVGCTTTF